MFKNVPEKTQKFQSDLSRFSPFKTSNVLRRATTVADIFLRPWPLSNYFSAAMALMMEFEGREIQISRGKHAY